MQLKTLDEFAKNEVLSSVPGFENLFMHDVDRSFSKLAVSVFDHWMSDVNDSLECKTDAERIERNNKFSTLLTKLYKCTSIFNIRHCLGKYIVEEFLDINSLLDYCREDSNKSPDSFFFLVLPEFGTIYCEDWDDTNVLFFRDRYGLAKIISLVAESGLHIIEFGEP